MSDQEQRDEEHREYFQTYGDSATCVQCGKEFLVEVMDKDYIVTGYTCRQCVIKIEELPEIYDYIDRLERNRDSYKTLADAYAKGNGGKIALHLAEDRHMETIREPL
jgi:transcription elongation factor Elf1